MGSGITVACEWPVPYSEEEYMTVYNAMTNKPSSSVATAQNTFVKALVDGSVWTKMDVLYLFAQENNNAGEALINWKNPGTYNATLSGTSVPTFASLEGFTGQGGNSIITTGWIPSSHASNYTLNSASIGAYLRIDQSNTIQVFSAAGDYSSYLVPRNGTSATAKLNCTNTQDFATVADSLGLFTISREDSSYVDIFKRGSFVNDLTCASAGLPTAELTFIGSSTNQISFGFAGSKFSEAEVTIIYNAIQAYMTSNSKQV